MKLLYPLLCAAVIAATFQLHAAREAAARAALVVAEHEFSHDQGFRIVGVRP